MGVISWAAQAFGPATVAAAIVAVLAFVWWLSRRDARKVGRRDAARERGDGEGDGNSDGDGDGDGGEAPRS